MNTFNIGEVFSDENILNPVNEFEIEIAGSNSESYIANETKLTLNEGSSIVVRARRIKEKSLYPNESQNRKL